MKKFAILLATMLGLVFATAPVANAAPVTYQQAAATTYWYAGAISEDANFGGAIQTINFVQYGACDSSGYSVDLSKLGYGWTTKITSLYSANNPNGCNRVTVYCTNGTTPTWQTSTVFYSNNGRGINIPCNDSAYKLRWWRAY